MTAAHPPGQIGGHYADATTIARLRVVTGGAGVVVGVDQHGEPVTVRLFRPEPTRCVVVGGLRLVQLLVFRALGAGATVTVHTGRPAAWLTFVNRTNVSRDVVRLVPPDAEIAGWAGGDGAAPDDPHLTVVDSGGGVARDAGGGTEAGTVLTAHDEVSTWNTDLLAAADLVLLRPLSSAESTLVGPLLTKPQLATTLHRLPPDILTILSRGTVQWARLAPTDAERALIGSAAVADRQPPPSRGTAST